LKSSPERPSFVLPMVALRVGAGIAWGVTALGAVVLGGYALGIEVLIGPFGQLPPMRSWTAVLFLLVGLGLALSLPRAEVGWRTRLGRVLAVAAALFAALLLVERLFALPALRWMVGADLAGRPSGETDVAFVLVGAAIALIDRRFRLVEVLVTAAAGTVLLVLLGYLYGYGYVGMASRAAIGMAPHTALGLLALTIGLLLVRPQASLLGVLWSRGMAGTTARRLMVIAAVAIPVIGAIAARLQHAGHFPAPGAGVIASTVGLLTIVGAVLLIARKLDRADQSRCRAEAALTEARDREAVQRALLESILTQLPEPVLVIDARGNLLHENASARVFRDDAAAARGGQPYDVRSPSGRHLPVEELPLARAAFQGEATIGEELVVRSPDGEQVPILVSAAPVRHGGEVVAGVALFRDIRPIKEVERLREEWSAVIAHDLRQPVNSMSLAADLLRRSCNDARLTRWAARIHDDARRLHQMIEDLLDVNRLDAHRMRLDLRPERLDGLVEVVLDRLPGLAERAEVRIAPEARDLQVDGGRLIQVLGNLLSNAAKYGDPGSPIRIEARAEDGHGRITVTNHGPGIPADELPTLFRRFNRTRGAQARGIEGIGLGLYICKGLVEAHGGRIWVESTPGATTSFHLTLPLADSAAAGAVATAAPASGGHEASAHPGS
jgi:PAS domain S-box-containing protein